MRRSLRQCTEKESTFEHYPDVRSSPIVANRVEESALHIDFCAGGVGFVSGLSLFCCCTVVVVIL